MAVLSNDEAILKGIGASPGIEYGPAFVYIQKSLEVPYYQINKKQARYELESFYSALRSTKQQISSIKSEIAQRLSASEASIFDTHLLILEDDALIDATIKYFNENKCSIAYCFDVVAKRFVEQFSKINDEHIRERCSDLKDIARRVLHNLLGYKMAGLNALLSEPRIVVADGFDPSEVIYFSKKRILALVTESGSCTSHAIIMARSLEIPAIVGVKDACKKISNGEFLLIDGFDGSAILRPEQDTLKHYGQLTEHKRYVQQIFDSCANEPVATSDNEKVDLWINFDGDVNDLNINDLGISGVGLVRTELEFLKNDIFPSEEEQFLYYKSVVDKSNGLPITLRTIDIGGDKTPKHLECFACESNPFLGFRAIRFCLENATIFKKQLRAILRASAFGNVRLLYPMITNVDELIKANSLLAECKEELKNANIAFDENIKIGAMIEVPSAAISSDLLAKHCDFFSIGTNDLVQYITAADRANDRITHLYEPSHPAMLRIIKRIVDVGINYDKKVSICGEMASDPIYIPMLLALGIRSFSVHVDRLSEIKYFIRKTSIKESAELLRLASELFSGKDIFLLFRNFYLKKLNEISNF